MLVETNKQKGNAGLGLAIAYFTCNGYSVSIPLNDTQWYDLIVEKDGRLFSVQCKFTASQNNNIDLRSTGGTNGGVYDHTLNHPVDYIFCADSNQNLYLIPTKDLIDFGVKNRISLRITPTSNNQGFQTYKYLVKI